MNSFREAKNRSIDMYAGETEHRLRNQELLSPKQSKYKDFHKTNHPPKHKKPSVLNIFPLHGYTAKRIDDAFLTNQEYDHAGVRKDPTGPKEDVWDEEYRNKRFFLKEFQNSKIQTEPMLIQRKHKKIKK